MFPAWPASGPEPNASRPPAHSFSAPTGQHLPFTFSSRSGQPVNRQMLFLQLRFSRRENTRCIFGSIQDHRFRLGRPIPPAANPITTSNKTTHFIPAPAGRLHPVLLPYASRPPAHSFRRQPANTSRRPSFHTGPQSSASQLSSSRLGRPTPYIPSHHFFNSYKAPSSHQVSLPTILPHIFLFLFSISPPSSRPSSFRTSNSNLIPPLSQRPPLLPSCCRFSSQQAKRET